MESDYSLEFAGKVKAKLTGVIVLKHCDRFTTGIPDLSVSNRTGRTVWVESKRLPMYRGDKRTKKRYDVFDPRTWVDNQAQLDTAVRLGAWFMVMDAWTSTFLFVRASVVYRAYQDKDLIPETNDGAVCDSDLAAFYNGVILTLTKELQA